MSVSIDEKRWLIHKDRRIKEQRARETDWRYHRHLILRRVYEKYGLKAYVDDSAQD